MNHHPQPSLEPMELRIVALLGTADILVQGVGVDKDGEDHTEGQRQSRTRNGQNKAQDPEKDLHGNEPQTAVNIESEDQSGQFDKSPREHLQHGLAYEIVSQDQAGHKGENGRSGQKSPEKRPQGRI